MITLEGYSDELTASNAPNYAPLKPNQSEGRVRLAMFTLNSGDAGFTDGKSYALAKLPKGARIVAGRVVFEAMGTTGAADIGLKAVDGSGYIDVAGTVADDDDLLGTAIDVSSAGEAAFAATIAQNMLYETEKEVFLVLTIETANWAADKDFIGYVMYVVD